MQSVPSLTSAPTDVMVRLIEENLWCGQDWDPKTCEPGDNDLNYLRETVFPSLVPALYELLKKVQLANSKATEVSSPSPTGTVEPVTWVAHYMLRNNAGAVGSRLSQHPYSIVNDSVHNRNTNVE